MAKRTSFDSGKQQLPDLMRDIADGTIQLPDFQRGWIWDDEHIRSLLSSVSRSFPIGAVMMLKTGNPDVRFRPRLIEGLALTDLPEPDALILDGQQRLTSLFQALLLGKPVKTTDLRKKTIKRWYYIDMMKALDPDTDREEAILGVPEDRVLRGFGSEPDLDLSSMERELAQRHFPVDLILDSKWSRWQMRFLDPGSEEDTAERHATWDRFYNEIIDRFQRYEIPVIQLHKDTPKEAVCLVFEKVNTGGVPLTVFELLTATYAADDYELREDWKKRKERLAIQEVLKDIRNDDFLQVVTLLATWDRRQKAITAGTEPSAISCKRREILDLPLQEYQQWADAATKGFEEAARFLRSQNILRARDIPYQTQLTPLAALLAILGDRALLDSVRSRLRQWYWCGVFGELYGSAVESRFARDVADVTSWIDSGPEPITVADAIFAPNRLLTLRTRNSAAYKGLFALIMRDGCEDFRSGEQIGVAQFFDENVDIHHIFPQKWCNDHAIDKDRMESFVNKTAISAKTNRIIGGNAPSIYLEKLQMDAGISEVRMDELLRSHVIDPCALRYDDFDEFFKLRAEELLQRIENAMGKPIARHQGTYTEIELLDGMVP